MQRNPSIPDPDAPGNRLQTEVPTQCQELGMQAGVSPRTVEHGRLEIVEDDLTRAAAVELQRMHKTTVELRFVLRETEFDVAEPAVAEDRDEHETHSATYCRCGSNHSAPSRLAWPAPAHSGPLDRHGPELAGFAAGNPAPR